MMNPTLVIKLKKVEGWPGFGYEVTRPTQPRGHRLQSLGFAANVKQVLEEIKAELEKK